MRSLQIFEGLLLLFVSVNGYKIVIFALDIAGSQVIWNVRVAEELVKAGHNVTLVRLQAVTMNKTDPNIMDAIEQWKVNVSVGEFEEMDRLRAPYFFKEMNYMDPSVFRVLRIFVSIFTRSCELVLENKEFMNRLKSAKFDLAFSHMYDLCPAGLIRAADIPTWIWLNSGQLMDFVADYMGVPSPPSYVPPLLSECTDEMTFKQRVKSLIGRFATRKFFEWFVIGPETAVFRKHIDPNFPDLLDVAKSCPLVMVNSNEMYNLPRPTLHKIIYIGGLGMKHNNAKPLSGEFKKITDRAKRIAVMTFGSHVNSSTMPEHWKDAFINAFKKFPDVEFIMRYSTTDLDAKKSENVHLSRWIPQIDLLQHEKTKVLITHGGYNSFQEAISSGTPSIIIPLFGDQHANSKLAEKHGISFIIKKSEVSEAKITEALHAVLDGNSYREKVSRLQAMVMKKPVQPEELLVKWTEFLAEFKKLDNLVPYGTKLCFFTYHSLDVICVLSVAIAIFLFLFYRIARFLLSFCISKFYDRTDKTELKLKKQ